MKKTFLAMCVLGCSSLLFAQDPVTPTPQDTTVTETTTPETQRTNPTTDTDMSTQNTDMSTQSSVGAYPAYSTSVNVPSNISYSFNTNYPGTANVNWNQRGQWYRASYNREGRTMHTYYAPNGKSFNVALPVLRGDIPDEMINRAISQYGDRLYAINSTRTGKGDVAYRVTLIDDSNTGMDNTAMNQSGMNNTMNTTGTTTQHNNDYRGLYFGQTRYEYFGEDGTTIQEIDMYRTETEDHNNPNHNMNNQNLNNQNLNNNNGTINNNRPTGYKKAKAKNSYAAATKKSSRKA
jgi:hypothetical protein